MQTPAKQSRMPRAAREKQLLDVALRLFIKQGYQGTSIEDLARAAGVTRPIIYAHFGSKDGIYLACLRRARAELDARLANGANSSDLAQRLIGGIDGYFSFVESDPAAWSILFGGGVAVAGPAAAEAARMRFATVERIITLIAEVLPHVDRETLEAYAHAVSGAGEQLAKWWLSRPKLSRAQVVSYHMAFASKGMQELLDLNKRKIKDPEALIA
jgi:AcrR family transcriptional regulator